MVLACARWNCKEGKDADFPTFLFCNISPPLSDSLAPDFSALKTSSPNGEETKLCNKLIQRERIRNVCDVLCQPRNSMFGKTTSKEGDLWRNKFVLRGENPRDTRSRRTEFLISPPLENSLEVKPSPPQPPSWGRCRRRGTCVGPGSLLCPAERGNPCTLYPHKSEGWVELWKVRLL